LSDVAEELLASLWPEQEAAAGAPAPEPVAVPEALEELRENGLVQDNGGALALTATGLAAAEAVVRRERLAERLLADVLNVSGALAAETACKFEHLLRRGIDDQICTLLGHPGSARTAAPSAGTVLHRGRAGCGKGGVVARRSLPRPERRDRLPPEPAPGGDVAPARSGRRPRTPVTLRQRFPSLVFTLGHTELAVDEETARDIYVRLTTASRPARQSRLRLGFRRGRHGR